MPALAPFRSTLSSIAALVLLLGADGALAGPGDVGEPAAAFDLESFDGGFVTLGEQLGKVVVLSIVGYG